MAEAAGKFEIGVDIGGTFTDVVCRDGMDGACVSSRSRRRGSDPSAGVRAAIGATCAREWSIPPHEIARFVHGTTVATNAVLERKGARIGLITTAGFKDVLEIGRQMRHAMYDLVLQARDAGVPGAGRAAQGGARAHHGHGRGSGAAR